MVVAAPRTPAGTRPILAVAEELGLRPDEVEAYGPMKAKVRLEALDRRRQAPLGRLVLVTAMTPTRHGEGKTTTAIGLADGLRRLETSSAVLLRQPALGPTFGQKGGAAGSARARLVPTEEVNLHLTGDTHAVGAAHNLAAAVIDNHLHHGNEPHIDPVSITWPRVVDMDDRALRRVRVGLGGGVPREAEWQITAASEVMAVLALAADRADLRRRLGRIVVARSTRGAPVTLDDLGVAGAMAALLRDALLPNLLQSAEGTPAFVHAGPFANIAHGSSSILADQLALRLVDVAVTEAGFGADLGAEKFFDITCPAGGLEPAAAVVVATVRSLRAHGPQNLAHQVGVVQRFGVPAVVAVNVFPDDSESELADALMAARESGAAGAALTRHVADGAAGADELARAVLAVLDGRAAPRTLYPAALPLRDKIERIAREIYGASGIELDPVAAADLERLERDGHGGLAVCMAKTPLSLSHDSRRGGVPTGYRLPVRRVRLFAGAGFVTAYCGAIQTMPGLPAHPAAERVELSDDGAIIGLG